MRTSSLVISCLVSFCGTCALLGLEPHMSAMLWPYALGCLACACFILFVRRAPIQFPLVLIAIALGVLAVARVQSRLGSLPLMKGIGTYEGRVIRSDSSGLQQTIVVSDVTKKSELQNKIIMLDVHITVGKKVDVSYGDHISFTAPLERLEDDAYGHYQRAQGIGYTAQATSVTRIAEGSHWHPFRILQHAREGTEAAIKRALTEPDASMIIGLLTGSRGTIPADIRLAFQRTGLTHILAISGYNITMILLLLSWAFCWLPLRWRLVPCALVIIAFTLFTGAGASVVRAAIMGTLGLFALTSGRQQTMRLSVLWTLTAMTAWNPLQLWWDAGFQLSFLSLTGILEFSPILKRWTERVLPQRFGIEESIRTTLSAQILTDPWILLSFGRTSVMGPIGNLLVLPAVPFAMATGAVTTIAELLWDPLGRLFSLLTLPWTHWILGVTQTLSALPFASREWEVGFGTAMIMYGLLVLWWSRHQT